MLVFDGKYKLCLNVINSMNEYVLCEYLPELIIQTQNLLDHWNDQ